MNLTVYSMGDIDIFTAVLNAVAMVFNSSLFDPAQGAGVVVMGMLLAIVFMIMPAMTKGKLDPFPFIFILILFYAGIVPKERLQVEDIYSGQITAVDNIPMIVALPAGISAIISHAITTQVETAFQTTSGSYLPMGQEGFVNPLKLLLSLRDPSKNAQEFPYLTQSIAEFVKYCAPTDSTFDTQILASSSDILGYLTGNGTNYTIPNGSGGYTVNHSNGLQNVSGVMTYWNSTDRLGVGVSCSNAQSLLATDGAAQIITNSPALLQTSTSGEYAKNMSGNGPTVAGVTAAYSAITSGIVANTQSAQNFMMNAIATAPVTQGVNCINQPSGASNSECMTNIIQTQALEQQNVDAAAQAGIFTKIAMPMMNLLLILFYSFAPIILAVALLFPGQHGLKVLGGFLLFGAWSQSWMPIAAVINYLIQLETQNAFSTFPATGMTMQNYMDFYRVLSIKIGSASTLMASVPMLSFALLSGSMMALTKVAQGMSGKDYTDEKIAAPSLVSPAAVATNESFGSVSDGRLHLHGGTRDAGLVDGNYDALGSLNLSQTASKNLDHTAAHANSTRATEGQELANTLGSVKSRQGSAEWAQAINAATQTSDSHTAAMTNTWASQFETAESAKNGDSEKLKAGLALQLFGNGVAAEKTFDTMHDKSIAQKVMDSQSFKDEQSRSLQENRGRSFSKALKTTASSLLQNSDTSSLKKALSNDESAQDSYSRAEAISNQIGLSNQQDLQMLGAQANINLGGYDSARAAIESHLSPENAAAYHSEEKRLLAAVSRSTGGVVTEAAATGASLRALNSVDGGAFVSVLQESGLAGLSATSAPAGADIGAMNSPLTSSGAQIDSGRLGQTGAHADKAAGVGGGGGANTRLVEGFTQVANGTVEKAIKQQEHLGAGTEIGKGRVKAEQEAPNRFAPEAYKHGELNEKGEITSGANANAMWNK